MHGKFLQRLLPLVLLALVAAACGGGGAGDGGFVPGSSSSSPPPAQPQPQPPPPPTPPKGEGIGLLVEGSSGEYLGAFGPQYGDGSLAKVTGATYIGDDGRSVSYWAGSDGLPAYGATSGLVIQFNNWTASTVDVYLFTPDDDLVHFQQGVPVDPTQVSALRSLATQGIVGKYSGNGPPGLTKVALEDGDPRQALTSGQAAKIVKGVSLLVSLGGCAAAVVLGPPSLGATLAVAALPCGGFIVSLGAELSGNETLDMVSTALNAYTCFAKDLCVGLGLNLLGKALESHAAAKDEIVGPEPGDPTNFTGLVAVVTPHSPQAFQNAIITATIFPRQSGISITLDLTGTDGYIKHETQQTGTNGDVTFVVPGGASGVRDDYTVESSNGYRSSGSFTYE